MNLQYLNTANVEKLLGSIERHGKEHLDLDYWFGATIKGRFSDYSLGCAHQIDIDKCGTVACVAGHCALIMHDESIPCFRSWDASHWLGMGSNIALFRVSDWPEFGIIGIEACNFARWEGDFAGVTHLLRSLIKEQS